MALFKLSVQYHLPKVFFNAPKNLTKLVWQLLTAAKLFTAIQSIITRTSQLLINFTATGSGLDSDSLAGLTWFLKSI